MKKNLFILALISCSFLSFGQDKYNYEHFDKLMEVEGTEFVIASVDFRGKSSERMSSYLLFLNTKTNESHKLHFPNDARVRRIEQVKIDSLNINIILLSGSMHDLNTKMGIDWNDPTQLLVISTDGKKKTQLTENTFFVQTWSLNKLTGTIVVAGFYDSNKNGSYDKTDQSEILIYDLKTLKLLGRA
jgi:hypothetical protein